MRLANGRPQAELERAEEWGHKKQRFRSIPGLFMIVSLAKIEKQLSNVAKRSRSEAGDCNSMHRVQKYGQPGYLRRGSKKLGIETSLCQRWLLIIYMSYILLQMFYSFGFMEKDHI